VVCDNCTDSTEQVARAQRVQTAVTHGNIHKKAGALNQQLGALLPLLADEDLVLVQDADSVLDPWFIARARRRVESGYDAVGGVFRGQQGGGFVGHLQRNEYARYARDLRRLRGRCLVITGTAALFQARALKQVRQARLCGKVPPGDGRGGIYDTSVLTEDNELTFALLHLGMRIISPSDCTLTTEVMPTWKELWSQRLRWKRGALENCVQYGLTRITWRYWGRQAFTFIGLLVTLVYIGTLLHALGSGSMSLAPVWMAVTGVFVIERAVTVSQRGWRQVALGATMYELTLDYFLVAVHLKAYTDAVTRRTRKW
jgi:cellulose synthase/poly-beta-1,6-N-acetylglucosamine synthase-like glycosyltransferase